MNKEDFDNKDSKSKLTLRLNTQSIERAKIIAAERNISVSKLVEQYFDIVALSDQQKESESEALGDRTKYLAGLLKRTYENS